jgi:hypothetical protein
LAPVSPRFEPSSARQAAQQADGNYGGRLSIDSELVSAAVPHDGCEVGHYHAVSPIIV